LQLILKDVEGSHLKNEVEKLIRAHSPALQVARREPLRWHFTVDWRQAGWYGFVFDASCPWVRFLVAYRHYDMKTNRWKWGAGVELWNGCGVGRFTYRRLEQTKVERIVNEE